MARVRDTADLRRRNLSAVLQAVFVGPRRARSDIAAATGLSPAAVTSLVAELISAGLVRESTSVPPVGKGRPRVLLEPAGDRAGLLTALLDADQATAVVSSLDGRTVVRIDRRHGRPMGDPVAVAEVLAAVVDEATAAAGRRIAEATVVVWAPVGGEPARVLADTDLGWREVDLLGLLRERSTTVASFARDGGAVRLVSDGEVAALAEHAAACSPGAFVYLKSDSGIGGAIVLVDSTGTARTVGLALGHLPVDPAGLRCACGQRGCLVTVAGPDVLLASTGLVQPAAEDGPAAALDEFVRRVRGGEPRAVAVWQHAAAEIARTLQITALMVSPDVIVLGGYLASLTDDIAAHFGAMQPTLLPVDTPLPAIVGSRWGTDAALRGAVHEARERIVTDPLRQTYFLT